MRTIWPLMCRVLSTSSSISISSLLKSLELEPSDPPSFDTCGQVQEEQEQEEQEQQQVLQGHFKGTFS